MKKIISMSVWGKNPRYIQGALEQIKWAKVFFPEWTVRIYADDVSPYRHTDAELVTVLGDTHGVFWRFRPLFESDDNIVMVRDSDGRLSLREKMMIDEWLGRPEKFHIFYDHEAHYQFPIIACAFAVRGKLPENVFWALQWYEANTNYYTNDQVYLREWVYPLTKDNCLFHRYTDPGWFGDTKKLLKNKYAFCGNGFDENNMPIYADTMNGFDHALSESDKFDGGYLRNG